MSLRKLPPAAQAPIEDDGLAFIVDNGDRAAMATIMDKWKFKDEESLLRFALAVLVQADEGIVSVKKSGVETTLRPAENLLRKD